MTTTDIEETYNREYFVIDKPIEGLDLQERMNYTMDNNIQTSPAGGQTPTPGDTSGQTPQTFGQTPQTSTQPPLEACFNRRVLTWVECLDGGWPVLDLLFDLVSQLFG